MSEVASPAAPDKEEAMILEGRIVKSGRFWAVEVASVGLFTQGRTRKQAEAMAADALEALAGKPLGASARSDGDRIYVEAEDTAGLVAFVLRALEPLEPRA
jgi:hypothetical protein